MTEIGGAIEPTQKQSVVKKDFREYPLLIGFFYWWLAYVPTRILYVGEKAIVYIYSYFSIPLLFKTLFDYWKKDEIDTTNMALDDRVRVMMMNLVSRFVGATVRSITILVGCLVIAGVFVSMVVCLVAFILLPFICVFLIINALARLG